MKKVLAAAELIIGCILMVMIMLMETGSAVRFGIGFAVMTICGKYARGLLE